MDPGQTTLDALGDSVRLTAEARDQNGRVIAGAAVTWSSSDASVATIDASGLVTASGNGQATITARAAPVSGTAAVTVRQLPAEMTVVPASLAFRSRGDTARLTATLTDANGHPVDGARVAWSSADTSVATVDASGLVTAGGVGAADVTATHDSLAASAAVSVSRSSSDDREVLASLCRAWDGDNWNDRTNWLTEAPLSDWAGVGTDRDGRVTQLALSSNNLNGRIPALIARLDRLYILNLSENALYGTIPPEFGQLTQLRDLLLGGNDLSGRLPAELGTLSGLRYLHLTNTNLGGPLPDTFVRLALSNFYFSATNLCLPSSLVVWYEGIDHASADPRRCIPTTADRDVLVALYEATNGSDWGDNDDWLSDLAINTWHGVKTDAEGYVTSLYLSHNKLTGPLPPALGNLARIERLVLHGNDLTGGIPPELGKSTNLRSLYLAENRLEGSIPSALGTLVNLDTLVVSYNELSGPIPPDVGDMAELEVLALFENRLSGPLPEEIGQLRNLRELSLSDNRIEGRLPRELGDLISLESLDLSRNQLSGPIPPEVGELASLTSLRLANNRLEGRIPATLGNLTSLKELQLQRNRLNGGIPRELGNLPNLESLGLFENQLTGAIPSELGNLERLERMVVGDNQLTGALPPELGRLSNLRELHAGRNRLSGPVPPELGTMSNLQYMGLFNNNFSGPLPPEIGGMSGLTDLLLSRNPDLEGLMPRQLLNLGSLSVLSAFETGLCAQIDAEYQDWLRQLDATLEDCDAEHVERLALAEVFAHLDGPSWTRSDGWNSSTPLADWHGITAREGRVHRLDLADNGVAGSMPPEISNLTALETMDFADNALAGEFPVALASMTDLTSLRLRGNGELAGPLPFRLTGLKHLATLEYEDTGLCASPAPTFQDWLGRVDVVAGATCGNPEEVRLSLSMVYLTQAVQRPAGDVPLIAGRAALLRVFLVSRESAAFFEPEVVATFTRDGREVHRVVMERARDLLATSADESDLRNSYNAVIPAAHIQPDVDLVVEADPGRILPLAAGSQVRFPTSGGMPLNVIDVPPMELTVVPVLEATRPDSSIFEWTENIGHDSPEVGLLRHAFPFSEFSAKSREAYVTSPDLTNDDDQWGLVLEMEALRALDNGSGYYYAAAASVDGYVRGRARLGGWTSIGKAWDAELAHEVGHNLNLRHAPCGGALGVDPGFPHPDGGIGAWGYDFRDGSVVSAGRRRDIMGYCYSRGWLSDYNFEKVIEYRERLEGDRARTLIAAERPGTEALVLWGGVINGHLRLEPAFRLEAPPRLPEGTGPYRVEGVDGAGDGVFSLAFTPGEDQFGDKYFFFTIPIDAAAAGSLDRITLTGPEGVVTIRSADERAISVVSEPDTGRIRAILRDWDGPLPAAVGRVADLDVVTFRSLSDAVRPPR